MILFVTVVFPFYGKEKMSVEKITIQQQQTDGSYNELYPKTDAWIKDETLSAQVASVLGLRDNYKPDDAFLGLYFGAGTYRYRVRVVIEDGTPVQGSTISGIQAIQGQSLVTNEQGYVLGKSTSFCGVLKSLYIKTNH